MARKTGIKMALSCICYQVGNTPTADTPGAAASLLIIIIIIIIIIITDTSGRAV
jgi:hypothetical protein